MPYLVDGHNLIPHIPGISLKDQEDELALVSLLEGFARQQRTQVEVFFDLAPPSWAGSRNYGRVKAHFIRQGMTADQAIVSRLRRMEKEAKNWTVVTSDREILAEAKSLQSKTLSSAAFTALLSKINKVSTNSSDKGENPEVSDEDVDYWLDQFGNG